MVHAWFNQTAVQDGKDAALSQLRAHVRSHLIEKGFINDTPFDWSYTLRDGRFYHEQSRQDLEDITRGTETRSYRDLARQGDIEATPMALETIKEAQRLASEGHHRILMPEQHIMSDGQVVVRYYTVLQRDVNDPSTFHASRLDIGGNIPIVQAKADIKHFTANQPNALFRENRIQHHVYAVALDGTKTEHIGELHKEIRERITLKRQDNALRDSRFPPVDAVGKTKVQTGQMDNRELQAPQTFNIVNNNHVGLMTDISRAVVRESIETIRDVSVFLRDRWKRDASSDRIVFEKDTMGNNRFNRRPERMTDLKTIERPMRVDEVITKRHSEMHCGATALHFIAETSVAVHAVPLFFALLAEKLPAPVRAIEKSMKRHKKKEMRLKNHTLRKSSLDAKKSVENGQLFKIEQKKKKKHMKAYKEILIGKRRYISGERGRRKEIGKAKRRGEKGFKKVAVAELLKPSTTEKREKRKRQKRMARKVDLELKSIGMSKGEKILLRLVKRLARRMEQKRKEMTKTPHVVTKSDRSLRIKTQEVVRRDEVFEVSRKKSKDGLVGISFALIVWLLLTHFEKQTQTSSAKESWKELKEDRSPISHEIHKTQKVLRVKESAPWILLSIIWYLAMAKEAGLVRQAKQATQVKQAGQARQVMLARQVKQATHVRQAKQKKKKMKQLYQKHVHFPKHAVIFAFNS